MMSRSSISLSAEHDIGNDVFSQLEGIDVQDCWDRSGKSRDGYVSPDEAAVDLIEEQLQDYFDQVRRHRELRMTAAEATLCRGVVLGLYRFEHESKSEFRQWADDIPIECASALLTQLREGRRDPMAVAAMEAFIRDCCPSWASRLIRIDNGNE